MGGSALDEVQARFADVEGSIRKAAYHARVARSSLSRSSRHARVTRGADSQRRRALDALHLEGPDLASRLPRATSWGAVV